MQRFPDALMLLVSLYLILLTFQIMLEDLNTNKLRQVDILMRREKEPPAVPIPIAAVARDLIPNTSYKAYVSVLNNRHSGPPSNIIYFQTAEGGKQSRLRIMIKHQRGHQALMS